jgi:hypothetical protein
MSYLEVVCRKFASINVKYCAADRHIIGNQERVSADALNVDLERFDWIAHGSELNASGINTIFLKDRLVNLWLGCACHSAISVRHDKNSVYSKQEGSQHQSSQNVVGYAGASVTKNFDITWVHANDRQRTDA